MPQFDISSYPSQIFWLTICFCALFTAAKFFILPQIREILYNRNQLIDRNLSESAELNQEIQSLNIEIESVISRSANEYKNIVENAQNISKVTLQKEISIVKSKIAENTKLSRQKIDELIQKSSAKNSEIISSVIKNLQNKFLI